MDLRFTPEEMSFRDELRAFFHSAIPKEIRQKVQSELHLSKEEYVSVHKTLHQRGWAVPHWPQAWGGQGWSAVQRYLWMEEMQIASVPSPLQFNVFMVGPVIAQFGNEAQKKRFLPDTASLDIWWGQGFSEPDAGSDLSGLKTRADRHGDHYVINGQKAWATLAQHADWIFLLARTDANAKKQNGISFFLVNMKTKGITRRPTVTIDGDHEVNEVFFDDVEVPAENLVGEENRGWDYAKFLLSNERTSIARVGVSKARLARAKRLASETSKNGRPLAQDPEFKRRVAKLEVQVKALELTQLRVVAAEKSDSDKPDPNSSILKIRGSELQQATIELLKDIAGPRALEGANTGAYFNTRKVSIYGGSNEIQRTIIAKAFLGMS